MNIRWHSLITLLFLLAFVTGCKDEKSDFINLSFNSFTFDSKGVEELKIEVSASQGWTVEYEGKWIIEKEKNANALVLQAMPTQSGVERMTRAVFRAGEAVEYVYLSQLGTNVTYVRLSPNSPATVLSPNGKYIGGVESDLVGNVYVFTPFIIEVATGKRVEKPKLKESHIARAITDDGMLIVVNESKSKSMYYRGDELIDVRSPGNVRELTITATSSDGNIWVGYAQSTEDRMYRPVKWINGEPQIMEMPEKTLLNENVDIGAYARGCSADGSVIYGALADDQSALYWKNDKVEYLGKDKINIHAITVNHSGQDITFAVADRPVFYADHHCMSPDGRYLATSFVKTIVQDANEKAIFYPAYFDFETETLTYITDLPDGFNDGSGSTINNEGILSFGCPATGYTDAFVYDIHTKTTARSIDYFKDEYGVTVSKSALILNNTNSGNTIFGLGIILHAVSYQYWYINVEE